RPAPVPTNGAIRHTDHRTGCAGRQAVKIRIDRPVDRQALRHGSLVRCPCPRLPGTVGPPAREGSEVFRRSDRGDEFPDEGVLAARNAATQAFLALDDEQRAVAEAVTVATELGSGSRLRQEWTGIA